MTELSKALINIIAKDLNMSVGEVQHIIKLLAEEVEKEESKRYMDHG